MAPLSTHHSTSVTKVLIIGDSGMGKTGALASLVLAGYNLRIMDFDNGSDILRNVLAPGVAPYNLSPEESAAAIARVDVEILTDKFKSGPTQFIPASADAWSRGIKLHSSWPGLGPISKWTSQDVLVVDSLNFAGRAAVRMVCNLQGRLAVPPQIQDYGSAQRIVDSFLSMLYSEDTPCNVVVLSHIREVGKRQTVERDGKMVTVEEEGSRRGYAETGTGQALSPNIGRFFNGLLMIDLVGTGQNARRIIRTVPHDNITLKNPAPGKVKATYDIKTGLADYFAAVRGSK